MTSLEARAAETQPSSDPPKRTRRARARRQRVLLGIVGVVAALAVWEIASRSGLVDGRYLPPSTAVFLELFRELGAPAFWLAVGQTMRSWLIGLAITVVAGTIVGFVIGLSPFLRRFTASTIEFLRPIPSVALVPLAVLVFGVRVESAVLLIVYACFWQMLIQVLYGVTDIDPVAQSTARTYGLKWFAQVRYVVLPSTLPYLLTGFRLSATIALVLAITSELVIGVPGIGSQIALAQNGARVTTVYALTITSGLLGLLINLLLRLLETKVLSWHTSVRAEAMA